MKKTGKILVLAYPDTYVTMSDEWICRLLPLVGLGTKEYIKAGHAALVLIENETGYSYYYDFGRYVTPEGYGRVRGLNTDAELEVPVKAKFGKNGNLDNFQEFLYWLDDNPQKTHGEGRLLASICNEIDFEKAHTFIKTLQQRGSIPYGAFNPDGSNCSRFVTDTILSATESKKIIKALRFNKLFTPSTVGNVEKAATLGEVFEVFDGNIKVFDGSAMKENLKNYFDKKRSKKETAVLSELPKTAQKLTGIGSNAWFELFPEELPGKHHRIRRYNDLHEIDYDGVYQVPDDFDASKPFVFTYDSHCEYCHVIQEQRKIKLVGGTSYADFNSSQKVRSA